MFSLKEYIYIYIFLCIENLYKSSTLSNLHLAFLKLDIISVVISKVLPSEEIKFRREEKTIAVKKLIFTGKKSRFAVKRS